MINISDVLYFREKYGIIIRRGFRSDVPVLLFSYIMHLDNVKYSYNRFNPNKKVRFYLGDSINPVSSMTLHQPGNRFLYCLVQPYKSKTEIMNAAQMFMQSNYMWRGNSVDSDGTFNLIIVPRSTITAMWAISLMVDLIDDIRILIARMICDV